MRRAEDDAPGVGERHGRGIVGADRLAPHRRPQVIALQPQDQVEDMVVEFGVDTAERCAAPAAERRFFVVDEDAAIFHLGRIGARACGDVEVGAARDRHVGPPGPRRHADLLRQVIGAEGRAAPVGADDHQRPRDTRKGPVDDDLAIGLPAAGEVVGRQPAPRHQPVDQPAASQLPDHHHRTAGARGVQQRRGGGPSDPCQIAGKARGGAGDGGIGIGIDDHRQRLAPGDQRDPARGRARTDAHRRGAGKCRRRHRHRDDRAGQPRSEPLPQRARAHYQLHNVPSSRRFTGR